MNRTEWALLLVALVGCRAEEPSDRVLGAERAGGAVTVNPSAPESSPASTSPEGPGKDHGTRDNGSTSDPNVCAGEQPPAAGEAVCAPADESSAASSRDDETMPSGQPARRNTGADAGVGPYFDPPGAEELPGRGAASER